MSSHDHKHTILYAEDDIDDLFMVREAFQKYDGEVNLLHASDGFQTIEQLKQSHIMGTLPCLIILDINMPGMDGRETLVRIKSSDSFKHIPAVLFTTSSSQIDRVFAETWGASFITKPLIFSELEELAHQFLTLCTSAVSEKA
ncbi:MAG TPA: response regulator [Flavisolibacter sp.]|nr:response regulator [Flavisolibacter sp.]